MRNSPSRAGMSARCWRCGGRPRRSPAPKWRTRSPRWPKAGGNRTNWRQVSLLRRARDQAREAYAQGIVALIDVLDADRNLLEATDRLAQNREALARASVAAVRAMGGGYGPGEQEADHHG
jgi:hypothetical protein